MLTITDDLFTGRGVPLRNSYFGAGIGIIWMDDVDCMGTEINLLGCTHTDSSNHNCVHNEDASVFCPCTYYCTRKHMRTRTHFKLHGYYRNIM